MKEFSLMPHGFLSYNFPIWGMKKESMRGIKLGSEWILELLDEPPLYDQNSDNKFEAVIDT